MPGQLDRASQRFTCFVVHILLHACPQTTVKLAHAGGDVGWTLVCQRARKGQFKKLPNLQCASLGDPG